MFLFSVYPNQVTFALRTHSDLLPLAIQPLSDRNCMPQWPSIKSEVERKIDSRLVVALFVVMAK
jgi:hypothetical protein